MKKNTWYITGSFLFLILLIVGGYFFFRPSNNSDNPVTNFFGLGGNVFGTNTNGTGGNEPQSGAAGERVFKIANGPVAGATFIQTANPTTTLARYVMATNGHIFDRPVGIPGAVPRPSSNTTIPGVTSALWAKKGGAAIMQYVDSGTIKNVYIELRSASSTSAATTPARIQFLPNSITSLTVSPDGASVAYLLKTTTGVDGYTANADGTSAKKLFSLPLSQILLSWPSQNTLMAQTKTAAGVPGMAFSIQAKTGAVSPLLHTSGLSALANGLFSKILYQTSGTGSEGAVTYVHDVQSGKDAPVANNPLPEKCFANPFVPTMLFCAVALDGAPSNYVDLWHQGLAQQADSIVAIDTNSGVGTVITLPGDGGADAPIETIGYSEDGAYLLFITRGDQSLWGVRLTN